MEFYRLVGKSRKHNHTNIGDQLARGDLVEFMPTEPDTDIHLWGVIGIVVWGVHEWHPEMISPGWNFNTNTHARVWLESQCQLVSIAHLKRIG